MCTSKSKMSGEQHSGQQQDIHGNLVKDLS